MERRKAWAINLIDLQISKFEELLKELTTTKAFRPPENPWHDVLLSQGKREEERQRREQIAASYEAAKRHQEGLEEKYEEIYDETEHLLGRLFLSTEEAKKFRNDVINSS